ncbi:Pre-rRNA-processing protein ESF2 [Suhomyces tanzawaensis NRRL Y-17324]|uniref:Pre-rRNA-processing protein ESF2 n=1 Tax=Suhomyces tanzawaensis NRRL Y-17324 TaxID=984487 RepID=A0A1E4SS65_9ASCO|nr:Pre-rRNA-processing protein ESF2 [Suhomyces tanzawaensis NRRL Y-17324]ODV82257.1 Pre-rRNA-processing protein ESF2 [Suhomyces tanzawaensis NRRL Y-17324]
MSDLDVDDFAYSDSEEEETRVFINKKQVNNDRFAIDDDFNQDNVSDEEAIDHDEVDQEDEAEDKDISQSSEGQETNDTKSRKEKKVKKLTLEQLEKEQKRIKKTGVCYFSSLPPYMKPAKLRSVLSRFGKIDRLFLKPEETAIYHKRVKYGGNKKKNFTEGWVEFVNKKDAKLCASTLNANKLGGKKTSYYYDDIMNIKYLSGFKWFDLTLQIAKENEIRQAKLALEISQQQKLNKNFINNVEKSKMISGIQRKRKEREQQGHEQAHEEGIRRSFKQRKVTSTRADLKDELKEKSVPNQKLSGVLSQVF